MTLPSRLSVALVALLASSGCARTYHPEYHPETRYSFVQNVSFGPPVDPEHCKLGRTAECWQSCFERSHGEACYLLGVMFETGHGVPRSHDDAMRMAALAAKLGYAPAAIDVDMAAPYVDLWGHEAQQRRAGAPSAPRVAGTPPPSSGSVTSSGGVVVYGSVNGDIYLGH